MLPPDLPPLPDWLSGDAESAPPLPTVTPPPPAGPLSTTPPPRGSIAAIQPIADADGWVRTTFDVPAERLPTGEVRLRLPVRGGRPKGFRDCRVSTARVPGLKQVQANRKPRVSNGEIVWHLGRLAAGEFVAPYLLIPPGPQADELRGQTWPFELTYYPEPAAVLQLDVRPPEAVPVGQPGVVTLALSNLSHGAAETVVLRAAADDGSGDEVECALEPIPAGGRVEVAFELPPVARGEQGWRVWAEVEGVAGTPMEFTLRGTLPTVALTVEAPDSCPLDTAVEVRIELRNTGETVAEQLVIECDPPPEFVAESASGWEIERLAPGEVWSETVRLRGVNPGAGTLTVRAGGWYGPLATTSAPLGCRLRVGTSGLLDDLLAEYRGGNFPADDTARAAAAATGERHILFALGEVGYAVPIDAIREVIRPPAVTPVPGTAHWLLGVTNVRGDIATVIDLPAFLDLHSDGDRRALLVVGTADEPVGFLVDEVAGIRRMTTGPLDPAVRECERRVTPFLSGVSEVAGRMVQVLDLPLIVAATEADSVA